MSLIAKPAVVKQENNASLLSFHHLLANYEMYVHISYIVKIRYFSDFIIEVPWGFRKTLCVCDIIVYDTLKYLNGTMYYHILSSLLLKTLKLVSVFWNMIAGFYSWFNVNHFHLLELVRVRNHIKYSKTHLSVETGFAIRLATYCEKRFVFMSKFWIFHCRKWFVFMSKFTLDHYSAIKDSLNIFFLQ